MKKVEGYVTVTVVLRAETPPYSLSTVDLQPLLDIMLPLEPVTSLNIEESKEQLRPVTTELQWTAVDMRLASQFIKPRT